MQNNGVTDLWMSCKSVKQAMIFGRSVLPKLPSLAPGFSWRGNTDKLDIPAYTASNAPLCWLALNKPSVGQ